MRSAHIMPPLSAHKIPAGVAFWPYFAQAPKTKANLLLSLWKRLAFRVECCRLSPLTAVPAAAVRCWLTPGGVILP
jgi:hypothetical protein